MNTQSASSNIQSNIQSNDARPVLSVCVITCLRRDGLLRLLEGLDRQRFQKQSRPELHVYVVDNDTKGSARDVVEGFQPESDLTLHYDIEPQRGIPFARNHAVDMAKGSSDFIAILDDDEVPAGDWLDELLHAITRFDAHVVTGPVTPYYVEQPPEWIEKGGFFTKRGPDDGASLTGQYNYVYTSNLLARAEIFQKVRFNEALANNGSDDTELFMQIERAGFRVAWADAAEVTEWIPSSRAEAKWLYQRAYRVGNGFALCELSMKPAWTTRAKRCVKGAVRIAQGALQLLGGFGRQHKWVHAMRRIYLGMGMVAGSLGSRYEEYANIHQV